MGRLLLRSLPIVLAACGSQGIDPNDLGDAGSTTSDGDPPPTAYTDPFAGAPAYTKKSGGDTAHNAGQACGGDNNVGCHSPGGKGDNGPALLIGGTVYQGYALDGGVTVTTNDGGSNTVAQLPAAGVEVRVMDTQGHTISTYSGSNGTFYIKAGNANGVALPAVVGVRDGTIARPMITQLTGNMGNCSQTSCHVGTENGGYYRVHIP